MVYVYLHFSNCLWYLIAHKRRKIVRTANSKHEPNSDVFNAKSSNRKKCKYSSFFLFQWPEMIVSVLGTWMIVDCIVAVRLSVAL